MAKTSVPRSRVETEPRVRRGYFECRYGQLHVHNAIPPGGGFEEGTPLLCVHSAPGTGRTFRAMLPLAGGDRSIYAPDLPGFGESDPPTTRPTIADYAAALGDFLDSMRFRQIDVLGYQMGSLVAGELAIGRPQQVRRVALASVPILTDAERAHFAESVHNGTAAASMLAAAQLYEVRQRLPLIAQPALVLRLKDEFAEPTQRARELLPKARFAEVPASGPSILETAPEPVLGLLRDFLRG